MGPEYGATCAIFPIDAETLALPAFTGRPEEQVALVEAYAKEQGLWHDEHAETPTFTDTLELDLGDVVPSLAGPEAPAGPRPATDANEEFREALRDYVSDGERVDEDARTSRSTFPASDPVEGQAPGNGGDGHPRAPARARARRARDRASQRVGVTLEDGDETELDHGARRHRRDHELHEHVEPVASCSAPACSPGRPSRRA